MSRISTRSPSRPTEWPSTWCGAVPGPPLLLLHGHPQTHSIWHKVAPALAERYAVVAPDLRGYGDSGKPRGLPGHGNYAKRAMAQDLVELMAALGHARFRVLAHDRGARVAHRLAVDHPDRVERLSTLDIAPTLAMYEHTNLAFAKAYWHWFFLIQPHPFPETLMAADPELYLRHTMGTRSAGLAPFTPGAWAEYLRCLRDPGTIHAICEDYRASAGIDLDHDREDLAHGRKVACPSWPFGAPGGWWARWWTPWRSGAGWLKTWRGGPWTADTTSRRKRRKPCWRRCCRSWPEPVRGTCWAAKSRPGSGLPSGLFLRLLFLFAFGLLFLLLGLLLLDLFLVLLAALVAHDVPP